jgi:hypothetical protein
MPSRLTAARDKPATGHLTVLRQILGLRKSTPHTIVFLESGGAPLTHSWLLRSIIYWNNLGALPPMSLFRRVALDSVSQVLLGRTIGLVGLARPLLITLFYLPLVLWR